MRRDEVVDPEEALGEEGGGSAWCAVAHQRARRPRLELLASVRAADRAPEEPRRHRRKAPRRRVCPDRHRLGLVDLPEDEHQDDPEQRLGHPLHVEGVAHHLEAAAAGDPNVGERDERDRGGGRAERGRRLPRGLRPTERPADRPGDQVHDDPDGDRDRRRDLDRPPDQRPDPARMPGSDVDRHIPDRGHVHPEPRPGRDDERELRADRHDPERDGAGPAPAERSRDQDVRRERADHEHRQPHDVLRGAGREDPIVLAAGAREDAGRARGRLEPALFLHVHGREVSQGPHGPSRTVGAPRPYLRQKSEGEPMLRMIPLALVAALTLAACASSSTTTPPAAGGTSTPPASSGSTVLVANSPQYGSILVDAQGNTLYLFDQDTGKTSACTGTCTSNWPALTVSGSPTAAT